MVTEHARGGIAGTGAGTSRLVISAVILPIVLALVSAGWLVWQVMHVSSTVAWVRENEQIVDGASIVQKMLLDQETGLRGFLITEDRAFLDPYEHAHVQEALDLLERSVADEAQHVAIVDELRREYLAWKEAVEHTIAAPAIGRQRASMGARKAQMDRMRSLIAKFTRIQDETRDSGYTRFAQEMRLTMLGAVTLLAMLGGAAAVISLRQIRTIAAALARERAALLAKDEFLSTLSHELRTPLTAILGWTQLLRQRPATGEALDRALATVERNAQAEAQIIDDILDTGRIATGKLKLVTGLVDLGTIAREAADAVRLSAEGKGVALEVNVAPGDLDVSGDAGRLQQVAWNLLSNAVKFTPRGGHVRLSVARSGSTVALHVTDDGEGIPKDVLPRVFERFWQADSSRTRRHGGLGLGLAIVKDIVTLHGGEVGAESQGPGTGATFTVALPCAPQRPAAATPAHRDGPPTAKRDAPLDGVRVLVVDDDPDTRELVASILAQHGADVRFAASAPDALDVLSRTTVDVLVSDIGMPGTSGYDLIDVLRRSPAWRQLPALALTAYAGAEDAQQALRAGFQRHLAKPIVPDRLVGTVAQLSRQGERGDFRGQGETRSHA